MLCSPTPKLHPQSSLPFTCKTPTFITYKCLTQVSRLPPTRQECSLSPFPISPGPASSLDSPSPAQCLPLGIRNPAPHLLSEAPTRPERSLTTSTNHPPREDSPATSQTPLAPGTRLPWDAQPRMPSVTPGTQMLSAPHESEHSPVGSRGGSSRGRSKARGPG